MSIKLPFWATFFTITGIIVLCGLGTWQLQRLTWKNDILQRLNTAYNAPQNENFNFSLMGEDDFAYGRIDGKLLADKAFLLGPRTKNKEVGNDLIVPLETDQGTLLVNMGWTNAPIDQQPINHLNGQNVWFEGLARAPHWNNFTPQNEPQNDRWYKLDIAEIAAINNLQNPIPYVLYADKASHKYDASFPNNTPWLPESNHLQYAFFWFTMAAALALIYALRFLKKPK